jgi:hypothetical protein
MEKTTQINTNKQNTKKQIDKDDKKILNYSKHHYLTEELIKNKYITCDDSQFFYYDKLFEQLIIDRNEFSDLITITNYIVLKVVKRDFKVEDDNEIKNKFGYFKISIISNINKLNNCNNDNEYNWLEDDLER